MNTPEEIARKWAAKTLPAYDTEDATQCILQAAAEMVRESGAVEALAALCNDGRTPWEERQENALACLREITKHGEPKT